ncbi:MAG TPA: chorismate mutase [Kofleriaceae bacterium]|nr:chorismate mutase [Kofleriaceae bacterium]
MEELDAFRSQLDELDAELVALVARRLQICDQVAALKRRNGIPMMQPGRVEQVKWRAIARGAELGLSEPFVEQLYALIIAEACRREDAIIGA